MGPPDRGLSRRAAVAILLVLPILFAGTAGAGLASYPVLPPIDGSHALSGLSSPVVSPGSGGAIQMLIADPVPFAATNATLAAGVYEFNAYPGNATGPVPPAGLSLLGGPMLDGLASSNGSQWVDFLGTIAPNTTVPISLAFSTSGSAPSGTYAIRFSLAFVAGGTPYLFESRGWFSENLWESATTLPGGASTLNLTKLGVSGVVPETAVLVRANPFTPWLYLLVVAALVLAGAGAYYATRDGPGSRSGARPAGRERSAPSALGNKRTRDGD